MSLQIPSGLITGVSGGGVTSGTTLPVVAYPIPVVLVGAQGASASGNNSILGLSGALNVNISGGNLAVSVSGDVVLVVSGGAIQVSGTVRSLVSGDFVFTSGGGSPNISGGVTVSGLVGVSGAGAVNWQSGTVGIVPAGQSGLGVTAAVMAWDALSGYRPVQATSGSDNKFAVNVFVVSGSVTGGGGGGGGSGQTVVLATSGAAVTLLPVYFISGTAGSGLLGVAIMGFDYAGLNYKPVAVATSGQTALQTLSNIRNSLNLPSALTDASNLATWNGTPTGSGVLIVTPMIQGVNNGTLYRWFTATAISGTSTGADILPAITIMAADGTNRTWPINPSVSGGAALQVASSGFGYIVASVSGNAVTTFGYTPTLVSGAVLTNVQSGRSLLHSIVINSYSSGGQFEVHNSLSGLVAANIIATVSPTIGSVTNADIPPTTLTYDAIMTSGIVISTSGANWNLTVNYKNPA